ncbi:MAG: ATP-binding protein [Phycisphaerales bacterium]|nr:ATP-binding protein [Phycisphaerales bacterium]
MNWPWMLVALAVGLLIGAAVARLMYDRQSRRVRDAEDRARRAERLAELGAMTGGLAHEIKNPLSTIGLNAQLIAEGVAEIKGGPGDEEVKPRLINRVGALRRETERLRGILQDFLEYAGSIRLEKRPTELNAVVVELVDFLTPEAERAGVRLRADLGGGQGGGGVSAPVDTRLLNQALLNLLLNAIQAIKNTPGADGAPFKGEVILRTSIEQRLAAGGPAKSAPLMAAVRVIDTGPGIAPETLARIFQPYFTTKSGGTGLGLPTARRLIEEHGGVLTVDSAVGRGTTFTALLPLAEPVP